MLEQLQTWWQNFTPEMQIVLQEGSLLLAALLVGYLLGGIVARFLRAKNFDAALRLPRSSPHGAEEHGITPTLVAGLLVRLTVWAGAASWLAHRHGRDEIANTLGLVMNRTWALATILVAALIIGSLLARRLIDCLQGLPKAGPEALPSRNVATPPRWDAAGMVGAGVYLLVMVLALLFTADLFDWPLTRTSALALWQFAQHVLIAVTALFIGTLGARWARELATSDGTPSPEKRAGQYTAMGIVAATTILAVALLLSSAGVLIGLAALAVLGFLLWMVRGYLPDITAGLQLRAHQVHEVCFEGVPWQVSEVGFVTTQVGRAGEFCRVKNRLVLEARMHSAPAEAASR
jgi:hypothetical protein